MKKNLCLFFSNDTSLNDWKNSGVLDREINYYHKFLKQKYNLIFLTFGDKKNKLIKNPFFKKIKVVPVYEKFYRPKNYIFKNIFNIILPSIILKKLKFNLIKVNQVSGGLSGILTSVFLKKKLLIRVGWEPNLFYKELNASFVKKYLNKIVSFIIYNFGKNFSVSSSYIKKYVLSNLIFKKNKKIDVIENYIDLKTFKKLKINKKKKKIIVISRLSKQKNLKFLINSLENSDISVDIIGDGDQKIELKAYAKKLNVKINFLGRKPNNKIPKILNKYSVYVICSKIEGNVKTLLEAMACELICIGSNVEGINNIISNKKNGFLVNNSKELKKTLFNIFKDLNKSRFMQKEARRRVLKYNSIDKFFYKELKILNSI